MLSDFKTNVFNLLNPTRLFCQKYIWQFYFITLQGNWFKSEKRK